MAQKLVAPRMGEGVEELTLVKWLKKEGDQVKELEPIVEVEADKVVTEIPCPASGVVLKLIASEGQPVKVGETLAWIGQPGEEIPAERPVPTETEHTRTAKDASAEDKVSPQEADRFLSPLVRKIAQENQVDLGQVRGSGKEGRITKKDVLDFLAARDKAGERPTPKPGDAPAPEPAGPTVPATVRPISSMRRTIADRMITSLRTSPHVLTVMEADLSRVQVHRALNKPLYDQDGVRLTLTAYFISAIVSALKTNPLVNSSWSDDGLIIHPEIHIGMAVSLGAEGLIVPVIKQADTLSLLGIARQVSDLADRARTKKLLPEEVQGGTFTLTNHGLSGSLFASPIINQPQVGILGTGRLQKRAVVVTDEHGNDAIAIRPMIYLSFVFDHRVLDGESADQFLAGVKDALENWD